MFYVLCFVGNFVLRTSCNENESERLQITQITEQLPKTGKHDITQRLLFIRHYLFPSTVIWYIKVIS